MPALSPQALRPGALFAFTVETLEGENETGEVPSEASIEASSEASGEISDETTVGGGGGGSGEEGWRMDSSGRYQHRRAYVAGAAGRAGFEEISYERGVARRRHADLDADSVEVRVCSLLLRFDFGGSGTSVHS